MVMAEVKLIIDLFDDINFGGSRRTLIRNLNDFRLIEFNDRASSVTVTPGPNFAAGDTARLWGDIDFQGSSITLPPGQYPDLRTLNFNDAASSMSIFEGPDVVAEDRQRETVRFNMRISTPAGTSLVSVQENLVSNLAATGTFIAASPTVRVAGSFVDEVVVQIRDNETGATRLATGRTMVPFAKNVAFPELAGQTTAGFAVVISFANVSSTFNLTGEVLHKTVMFDLITRVLRGATAAQSDIQPVSPTPSEIMIEVN